MFKEPETRRLKVLVPLRHENQTSHSQLNPSHKVVRKIGGGNIRYHCPLELFTKIIKDGIKIKDFEILELRNLNQLYNNACL